MSNDLRFTTEDEYCAARANIDFWWPYIIEVLQRHNLAGADKREVTKCGFNPTYPVFLIDDIVIKFFGHRSHWRNAFTTECAAHEYLSKDDTILASRILATGELFPESEASWSYILSSKIPGQSWLNTTLTFEEQNNIAAEIGRQLHKSHSLPLDERLLHDHAWSKLDFRGAADKSILPKHLVAQVEDFITRLDDFDRCFVNGDIVPTHIFIENGQLTGIIDWGDATITDRHYELGKLMDTFDWDKRLLKTVLQTSDWPIKANFSKQALGLSLYRQAVGLTQHSTFDVFYKLPHLIQLDTISTLDELADTLFGV